MKSILRVFSYLRHYPGMAAAQLFCAIGMTLAVFVFPNATGHVIDKIIPNPARHGEFSFWIFVALLGFLTKDGLNSLRIFINNTFEQKVIFDIRSDLYAKIQRLPLRWFDSRRTGDIMTRVVEDVTNMERVLIDGVEQGLVAALQVIGIGIFLFFLNPTVAAWATLPVPFLAVGAWIYSTKGRDRYRNQRDAASDLNALLHDNISGVRQIKAYAAETAEHARFNRFSDQLRITTLRMMRWWAIYSPGMSFLRMTGYVLVLAFGGAAVMDGSLTLGDFTKFLLFLSLFYEPIDRLNSLNQMLLSGRAAADRVFEILDSEDEPNAVEGAALPEKINGHVRFENVSFSYQEQPTLHDVTLDAPPGQTIALVGSTGAGKTTVLSLLARFYEATSGTITIDGIPIQTLAKSSLRDRLAYVTQEPFLFNGTVRENLLLSKRDATDADLWTALTAAHAETLRPRASEAARHQRRRARRETFRRRETAAIHRPRAAEKRADPAARRGHRLGGLRDRAPDPGRARPPDGKPHRLCHRPPAFHHPECGPDLRAGKRRGHRTRHPRHAARPRREIRGALPEIVPCGGGLKRCLETCPPTID